MSSLVMLAHEYKEQKHKIEFPCFVQPKLDGVRATYNPRLKSLTTRHGKSITGAVQTKEYLDSIADKLPYPLDGELIMPGVTFNVLSGIVRRKTKISIKEQVEFHVFDIISPMPQGERFLNFTAIPVGPLLKLVPTSNCGSHRDIEDKFIDFIANGHEGVMIRNANAFYENKRSYNLLKYKVVKEIDCVANGFLSGDGKYLNTLGAIETECNGKKFTVGSGLSDLQRNEIWNDREAFYGKVFRVNYQELSEFGVPRFPIFKGFLMWG